jgi:hypothetical protein
MNYLVSLLLALALLSGNARADSAPAPFEIEYSVSTGGIELGTTSLVLKRTERGWELASITAASGLLKLFRSGKIIERSELENTADGLRIQRYSHTEEGREADRQAHATADWPNSRLDYTYRGRSGQLDLPAAPLYDRLSSLLGTLQALARGERQFEMQAFDGDEIKTMRFATEKGVALETPLGKLQTLRVERIRDNGSRQTIMWHAPELDYLPVQMEQYKRGDLVARLKLVSLRR